MAKTALTDIKTEIVVFLRNQNVLSISTRGVTTVTELFSGTGALQDFTLAQITLKNVRQVLVSTVPQTFGTDYTVNYTTGTVHFNTAPPLAANNVSVQYDYGSTDRIFPDFPQPHLKLATFPRIAVDVMGGTTSEYALFADGTVSEYNLTVACYSKDQDEVESMIAAVRTAFMDNKKLFYYSPFITPTATGPIIISPFGADKIFERNQDLNIRFVYES